MRKLITMHRAAASALAVAIAITPTAVAFAEINNTVTVNGNGPGGAITPVTADESVDVQDAAPVLTVTKIASDDTDVNIGDTVTYTYTVTNTGNVTVTNASLSDAHQGAGTLTTITMGALTDNGTLGDSTDDAADNEWDSLAPGDTVTWTSTYTVLQADVTNNGGGDGDIDNTVTASAGYLDNNNTPQTVTGTQDESIDLIDQNPSLLVAKVADDDTDVTVGQVITYTYTVTNNGNVPITAIALADNVTAGSGPAPTPTLTGTPLTDNAPLGDSTDNGTDQVYDTLAPGDVVTYTGTYTVTQSDVDNLQ
jgi:uncharacterized repeat protein (TIGR01451 family)